MTRIVLLLSVALVFSEAEEHAVNGESCLSVNCCKFKLMAKKGRQFLRINQRKF